MHYPFDWITRARRQRSFLSALLCLVAISGIGIIDYWADYRILFTILYVLPIGFSTLYVGPTFAVILSLLGVMLWTGGDILSDAPSPGIAIRMWNDAVVISLFLIIIYLLDALRQSLTRLETTVENRTEALRREMEERRHLEREILDLSEKERQSFGHDLHDTVCQDLASTAIAGHLLAKKLQAGGQAIEAEKAREIAEIVDRALTKARSVARGFFTAGFDLEGLVESLHETARGIKKQHGIQCEIRWPDHLKISDENVVMHFFRIAQEAIQNAVKHAKPTRIDVSLKRTPDALHLTIEDNGMGFDPSHKSKSGLGLRIMTYRAGIIGGELRIESTPTGGTRIVCLVPQDKLAAKAATSDTVADQKSNAGKS